MTRSRTLLIGCTFAAVVVALGLSAHALDQAAKTADMVNAPRFEVEPMWPKPLPNNWLLGQAIGIGVDSKDNLWIVHRPDILTPNEVGQDQKPPLAECCRAAPPVLAFDQAGNVIHSWGGPGQGYTWPGSNHGIFVDHKGFVWIGGNGNTDSHVLKFTQDGKFVAQYGTPGQGATRASNATDRFGRVAKIFVDPRANEAYLADGYLNRRVAVLDGDTGAVKRYWGAYGNKPDDGDQTPYDPDGPLIKQFRTPVHCADLSNDNLVYVCDRVNNRIQVFTADGKFVKETQIAKRTGGDGSIWDVAFSKDPKQTYLYVADGKNERIYVLLRDTLEVLTAFGGGGRQPGQFFAVHSLVTDSRGNIFTTETYEGRRIQKFTFRGVAQVPRDQGVVWPKK
jgi:DNA-binding beta-propeller fold protein YncE